MTGVSTPSRTVQYVLFFCGVALLLLRFVAGWGDIGEAGFQRWLTAWTPEASSVLRRGNEISSTESAARHPAPLVYISSLTYQLLDALLHV